jgi:hypothetical protein
MCSICEHADRHLWASGHVPALVEVDAIRNSSIRLSRCSVCAALWCVATYEPYARFEFACRWPFDGSAWVEMHDRDAGATLLAWHAAMIRDHWESLPAVEREVVQEWRTRTYHGHNPIDRGPSWRPVAALERAEDIERLLRAT